MKNFKSNLKQTVRAFPLLVVMLLCSSAVLAVPGWSNTNMTARQSTADELTDRQVSSAWQPTYQGYRSQIFEVGTTNVPSDYSEVSSGSSDEQGGHKGHMRKLGGGTDVGEQSNEYPIGEPWILLLFALLACGVIAYHRMNIKHNKNMKNKILNQLFSSCKKWKTLVLISMLLTLGVGQMWAYDISANTTVVWDAGKESWTTAQLYIYKSDYNTFDNLTRIGTTTQFYKLYSNSWNGYSGLIFRKDASWSAQTTDITRSISGTILFTYTGSKNNGKLNWGVTTSAKKATSGTTLYFDNTATQWTQPRFKYGTSSFNRYFDMVAVPGTANLWKYTLPNDVYYWKYMVSQDFGWTDYNTIEDTHCNNYTAYQTSNLSSATTLIPSTNGKPCTTETLSGYTRSVTITSPSNGTITVTYTDVDESSKTKTSGSFNVAQTCIITVTATPNTGYVLSSLTVGGASFTSGNTYIVRANTTISASFVAETTHDVAVSYICTDTEATVKAGGSVAVGETTASTFEAGTPNGYSFTRWVIGNGLTITSGSTTSNSISVKTKSTGTYTLKAEYTEVLTTSWYISGATGGGSPFSGLTTSGTAMTKKHGYSAIEKYYCTISVSTVASGSGYSFTPYNSSNSRKYGNASANITKANNSATVYSDNSTDLHFLPYVAGDYEFELDNTGANPVLTVTWPVFNQIRFYSAQTGGTGTNTYDFNTASTPWTKTVNLTAGSTYWFKVIENSEFFGNTGTMTRTNSSNWTMSNVTENCGITPDFTGDYTFSYNPTTNILSVTYPTAFTLTYDIGTVKGGNGSITSSPETASGSYVLSGNSVTLTAPNAKTGYTWKGWYLAADGSGTRQSSAKAYAVTMNADKTLYACYTENAYNVTVSAGSGGTVSPSGTVSVKQVSGTSITATPNTDFIFKDWTISGGGITPTTSSTSPQTFKATTTGGTITANFTNQWAICGIDDWETWNGLPKKTTNVYEGTVTLTAGNHTFKVVDRKNNTWYGKNSTTITRASSSVASLSNSGGNITITADVPGTYTFNFNTSTKNLTVTYPTAYTITYGAGTHNGSSTAISVSPLFNSGDYVLPETDVTFTKGSTKTGYTWKGWYPAANGTGTAWSTSDANLTLTATRTGNINVYACYNLVNYTITYNLDGGTNPVSPAPPTSYTIESADIALPTPTKEGYVFAGWYSDAELTTPVSTIPTGSTGNKAFWAKWDQKGTYTIYYYNKDSWANTHAYIWDGGSGTYERAWPGERMFTHQGKVYKHDYELSSVSYDKVIFNNNDGTQTSNLDIADGASGNKWFYNPNDATVNAGGIHHGWSQYFMIADYPTTKQVAVVGEKITIDPVFSWAEGVDFDDINITANRDSGSTNVTAMVAGTKIIATATAAGTAKYTITYSYLTTTITKVIRFQFAAGITVQSKVPKTDPYWQYYQNIEGIHYWGTNLTPGDVKMTWLKADENYDYYQALVPLGTDNKTNFLFYFDSYSTDAWRKTLDVKGVTSDCCYTITLQNGNKDIIRKAELSGTGLCSDSYQVVITMGSGDIYTSNIVTSSDEIVSFFAPDANESKSYRRGTVTLEHNGLTVHTYPANTFSASGVYTATINANYSFSNLALYTGDYYIRTDGADGGWDHYKDDGMHNKMTEFTRNTNFPNESFSYYWVANVGHGLTQNIKGTVANDYNPVLCSFSPDETANEPDGINLRFGYEPTTNDLVRGIIGGSTTNNFLNIVCADGSLIYKEMACTTLLDESHYESTPQDSKFQDKSNWVYEVIVYAKIDATHPVANVVLNSYYYGIHYLLGMVKDDQGRETSTPVSFPVIKTGTTEGVYGLRVVYDFKTNRLFAAWAPADRVIDGVLDVDADVMFLRHEDGDAAQISFNTNESRIEEIKQAIFALELDNEESTKIKGKNIERHYFISLPFDCNVKDIFGIGGFMNYWGIQRYNGAKRAQIGWFQDTPTFWEWLGLNDVMNAGEGYLLSVDKDALERDDVWKEGVIYQTRDTVLDPVTHKPIKTADGLSDSVVWVTHTDGSMLTMYFPSTTSGFTITPATGKALTITYPDQPCSITRDDRDKKDSNWKCIGTPGYKNVAITGYNQESEDLVYDDQKPPRFLYEFHEQTSGATWAKGTYTVTDGSEFTYHSFHSYMVQFAGTIDWAQYSKGDVAPSPIAPKRMPTADTKTTKVEIELLSSDDDALDRTFVWLQENATTGFDQNYDLNKMIEKKANQIYSLAENEVPFAANVLPLGTDTVPLVVNIANEGEYTFSLNVDKHVGMAPILYDMYKSEQINLLTTNYAVELEKGKHEDRFFLLFQPEAPIVTNFEATADGGQNVHSSEAIYDVLGRRVNTIYPGHLYIVNGEKRIAK